MAKTMRAVVAKAFGKAKDVLCMVEDRPVPELRPGSGEMLIKVYACSVTPGDERMLSGDCCAVKKPKEFPYVPGLDVAGVVVEVDPKEEKKESCRFKVGDEVVGTWDVFGVGGMAEYATVRMDLATHKPKNLSFVEAAGLCNSAVYAMLAVKKVELSEGARVLILGGGGGLGTALIQLARHYGASFVACTSTQNESLRELGADLVVDYKTETWWKHPDFKSSPFDVIFDCAEGVEAWAHVLEEGILKPSREGGKFLAFVQNEWHIQVKYIHELFSFLVPVLTRHVISSFRPGKPRYITSITVGTPTAQSISDLFKIVANGGLKLVLDPFSPHPFTEDGVKDAFEILEHRKGHGKIVVEVLQK